MSSAADSHIDQPGAPTARCRDRFCISMLEEKKQKTFMSPSRFHPVTYAKDIKVFRSFFQERTSSYVHLSTGWYFQTTVFSAQHFSPQLVFDRRKD